MSVSLCCCFPITCLLTFVKHPDSLAALNPNFATYAPTRCLNANTAVCTDWLWESRSQLNNVRVMFAWFISTSLSPSDVDQQDAHVTILHWLFTWVCLMIECMGCLQTRCLLDLPSWWIYYRPPKEHLENRITQQFWWWSYRTLISRVPGCRFLNYILIFAAYTFWSLLYTMYISEKVSSNNAAKICQVCRLSPWIPKVLWFQCLQSILACNDAKLLQRHLEAVVGPAAQRSTASAGAGFVWELHRDHCRGEPGIEPPKTDMLSSPNQRCSIGKGNVFHWQRECARVFHKGDLTGYLTILQALPIDWLIDWLVDWLIGWLFDWLTDWLIDWVIGWLVGWLVGWNYLLTLGIWAKFREMELTQKKIYFNGFVFCFV